ncbi:MAG: hypothetical protein RIR12_1741 [Bacteroidota bacterium]|jgi:hypothetical protein
MKKYILGITIFYTACYVTACSKNNDGGGTITVDCSTVTNKAFAADVSPIIQSSCATVGCHASGSANGVGALTNYTEIFTHRSRIRTAIANGSMPQGGSLSTTQKNTIICWIDNGAPNN